MKKVCKSYVAIWAVLFVLFQVISFVSVGWTGEGKYTPSFWTGYIFITLAFIGQLVCALVALKEEEPKKTFYKISLLTTSYTGLILSFIFGGLCMVISPLPYWVGILLCAGVLAANVIAIIKASAAVDIVGGVDEKVKAQTLFIKSLTVDAEGLVARAKSEAVKAECKKLYEAIRYSDPMSHDALASVEGEITVKFSALTEAVKADHVEEASAVAAELAILVADRNKKCKLLK